MSAKNKLVQFRIVMFYCTGMANVEFVGDIKIYAIKMFAFQRFIKPHFAHGLFFAHTLFIFFNNTTGVFIGKIKIYSSD